MIYEPPVAGVSDLYDDTQPTVPVSVMALRVPPLQIALSLAVKRRNLSHALKEISTSIFSP